MRDGQLTWRARGELWLRLGVRLLLVLGGLWLLAKFGRGALSLLAPFVAALIVAALLNPAVKWFQRKLGWSRGILTLLLLLLLVALLGGAVFLLGYAAVGELMSLAENWDALVAAGLDLLGRLDAAFRELVELLPIQLAAPDQGLLDWLMELLPSTAPDWGNLALFAGEKAASMSSFLLALVFFVMATYLLTADYPYLRGRAVQHMDERLRRFCSQVKTTALAAFGGYLRAQLLLSLGVFFILLAGFLVTRQSYGLLLALGLAVLDFIPIIGAGTVMVPWAFIALFNHNYNDAVRVMVIWGIIAVFRRLMEPKVIGSQTGLAPVLSLASIYVGMRLGGVMGMILAPILLLVLLNLAGLGLFDGVRRDLYAAADDIAALLRGRTE